MRTVTFSPERAGIESRKIVKLSFIWSRRFLKERLKNIMREKEICLFFKKTPYR